MAAIEEKLLDSELRCEIVRDLVTHMYSFVGKPTSHFIEEVSKLVANYPFMKDSGKDPCVSNLTFGFQCIWLSVFYTIAAGFVATQNGG